MYLGTQIPARSDDDFRIMAQLGINSVDEIGPQIFWNPPNWVPRVEAALKAAAE